MKPGTGGRLAWLPVFFLFFACDSFSADSTATSQDGGTGSSTSSSSSSGSTISDAGGDGPDVVDGGTCLKVGGFDQNFPSAQLGKWVNSPGPSTTQFTLLPTGGKDGDGAVGFNFPADSVNARRNVVETTLPGKARCFEYEIAFRPVQVDYQGIVFTGVKFQNDHFLGLAIDTSYHVILGQQTAAVTPFAALATSVASIAANVWHTVVLKLELLSRSFTATAIVDGSITLENTPDALLELDYTKSVEAGVSYVAPTGVGNIEIDRVTFR